MASVSFFFSSTIVALSCLLSLGQALSICKSESAANPVANLYPNTPTGTINGTVAFIPIPLDVAQSLIPSEYGLLPAAAKAVFPTIPDGMFPMQMEALQDHDVQQDGIKISDFTRMSLRIPFVDRLDDGYSSFRYTLPQLLSGNLIALLGSAIYGETIAGDFDPPCNAFATDGNGGTFLNGYVAPESNSTAFLGSEPAFATYFIANSSNPYTMEAFRNVSNQPSFSNGLPVCDHYITLFNTSLTTGANAPVSVKGTVSVVPPFYNESTTFSDVWGYRLDTAFVEHNNVPCKDLQGYSGTGSGD